LVSISSPHKDPTREGFEHEINLRSGGAEKPPIAAPSSPSAKRPHYSPLPLPSLSPPKLDFRTPPGFDRTRNAEIGNKDISFKHLEEAFTSEHWLVRIYKVKQLENRQPLERKLRSVAAKQKYTSRKVT